MHDAHIVEATLAGADVQACLLKEISSWSFDATGAISIVTSYPFTFGANPGKWGARPPAFHPQGGLSPAQVRKVVMAHTGELRACYEAVTPGTNGTVTTAWKIDASGTVHDARIVSSTVDNASIENCIVALEATWQFDASTVSTDIMSYPFKFAAGSPDAGAP